MRKKKAKMNKEITWNIVNSLLAGGLVFLGACTSGGLNAQSIMAALTAALIVAITKFKNYWELEEAEYKEKILFNFVH